MRRVLLHLGLHKTGTTAAQSFLFDNRSRPHDAALVVQKAAIVKRAQQALLGTT